MGLGTSRDCMVPCPSRDRAEGLRQDIPPDALHGPLSHDGLACRDRNRTTVCQGSSAGPALAICRRPVVHRWGRLFCHRFTAALRPPDLASFRHGRYDVPLLCSLMVCELVAGQPDGRSQIWAYFLAPFGFFSTITSLALPFSDEI